VKITKGINTTRERESGRGREGEREREREREKEATNLKEEKHFITLETGKLVNDK